MTGFCVQKLAADSRLRSADGILPAEALTAVSDARELARHIEEEARSEAQRILAQAREQAEEMRQAAEVRVFERAAQMLAGLDAAADTLASRVSGTVVDLVTTLLDRALLRTPPRARIEASLKRLRQEAPARLVHAELCVHPDDAALLPEAAWEVRHDISVARGACRLVAENGEWHADFEAAVESLRTAFLGCVEHSSRHVDAGGASAAFGDAAQGSTPLEPDS